MLYTIYQVTNLLNGKIYIGKHQTTNPNDSYYGSGAAIKKSIAKHGKDNFKKEVLFVFKTEEEMNAKETELITEEFVARSDTYNMGVGGEGGAHFKGKSHSVETIARIKQTLSSDESKQKLAEAGRKAGSLSKGRKLSTTARRNMSDGARNRELGREVHDETKKKISDSLKKFNSENPGYHKNLKKRIRKPLSEETKKKLSDRKKEYWKNKKGCT
jgi:hypothetical protein